MLRCFTYLGEGGVSQFHILGRVVEVFHTLGRVVLRC